MEKSILITGCSSGIGLSTAILLKKHGYRVFATVRKPADVEKLRTNGFESIQLDLTDASSMQKALDLVLTATGGTLFALFNNAGFLQAGLFEDLTPELVRNQFETNVFGPIELTRLILPLFRKQGYGRIIMTSSILGVVTIPNYSAYNASKFALEGFTNTLRQELYGSDIFVSLINPGPIKTKLRENAYQLYLNTTKLHHASENEKVYQKLEKTYFDPNALDLKITVSPEVVAEKVLAALESTHPKTHYFVGLPARTLAFFNRLLPYKVIDWLVTKI